MEGGVKNLGKKYKRINITMDAALWKKVTNAAKALGMSRSRFLAEGARELLGKDTIEVSGKQLAKFLMAEIMKDKNLRKILDKLLDTPISTPIGPLKSIAQLDKP
jgi:metal-responsive CopG/Arc/MetJ family transcriptional regulator